MDNIPLVDDSLVHIMELMMKKQDFMDYEVVLALFTVCHCIDGIIDEIEECDLPEMLRDDYRAVRSSISSLTKSIEQYRDENIATFIAACED